MAERVYQAIIEKYDMSSVNQVQSLFNSLSIHNRQEMKVSGNDLLGWTEKSRDHGWQKCCKELKKKFYKND